ncbi:MAG: hypothetical protein R3C14_09845 [Caldilineaceae bacterium]
MFQRYHQQQAGAASTTLQRVAISATVPDPAGIVARYLTESDSHQSPVSSLQPRVRNRNHCRGRGWAAVVGGHSTDAVAGGIGDGVGLAQ